MAALCTAAQWERLNTPAAPATITVDAAALADAIRSIETNARAHQYQIDQAHHNPGRTDADREAARRLSALTLRTLGRSIERARALGVPLAKHYSL
jgi:hypothetical protein